MWVWPTWSSLYLTLRCHEKWPSPAGAVEGCRPPIFRWFRGWHFSVALAWDGHLDGNFFLPIQQGCPSVRTFHYRSDPQGRSWWRFLYSKYRLLFNFKCWLFFQGWDTKILSILVSLALLLVISASSKMSFLLSKPTLGGPTLSWLKFMMRWSYPKFSGWATVLQTASTKFSSLWLLQSIRETMC